MIKTVWVISIIHSAALEHPIAVKNVIPIVRLIPIMFAESQTATKMPSVPVCVRGLRGQMFRHSMIAGIVEQNKVDSG